VAHDFNNLLTIIRSATDFLRRRELPEERRRRYIDAISETVERASKLTGQLLAFARRQPLKPQVFNVGTQVESVAQLIRPLVGARVRIDLDIADNNCFAIADIAQFETALINLAVNSRDAMDSEGRLTIRVRKLHSIPPLRAQPPRSGEFVAIAVTDTGIGIAPELLETIFEPFFTTKEVGKGTGLGLSMVYGFVKQSGGHIRIDGEEGYGTSIKIYLPRATGRDLDAIDTTTAASVQGGSETILVVEDDRLVRQYVITQLVALGYRAIPAANADEALVLIDQGTPCDLLFTDVIMPGSRNGRELAGEVLRRRPGIKVLYTSGYSQSAIIHNGRLDQGVLLLTKPYRRADLAQMIRVALREAANRE
jgi:CheY-like chemotaxis protein